MSIKRKAAVLAVLILGVTAAAALAATLTGDGTLVGTSGADTFNVGSGKDTVFGEAGSDTINANAPKGSGTLWGDGQCMGDQGMVVPPTETVNCEGNQGQDQNGQGDTFNVGTGSYTTYGGRGVNTYNVAGGTDTIWGGPHGDTFNLGPMDQTPGGNYTVYLCGTGTHGMYTAPACLSHGGNVVNLKKTVTAGIIDARNGYSDTINCNGAAVTVYADHNDVLNKCKNVSYGPFTARDLASAQHRVAHKASRKHKTSARRATR